MAEELDRVAMVSDVRRLVSEEGERTRRQFEETRRQFAEDGERTRRHFDIMVEKVEAAVKLVAEVNAHHAVVLDNHETRLKHIEKTR